MMNVVLNSPPRPAMTKFSLIELILNDLNFELEKLSHSAQSAHEAATHEESRAEDSHDTRAIEASYLAGAQRARIESLKKVIVLFQFSTLQTFSPTDFIRIGALIQLDFEGKVSTYLLMSNGGGMSVPFRESTVQVITPQSPLGDALLGKKVGEIVEVEGQRTSREYKVISIE